MGLSAAKHKLIGNWAGAESGSRKRQLRRRSPRWILLTSILAAAFIAPLFTTIQTASAQTRTASVGSADWPSYLYGPGHTSYNANATAITPTNASDLAKLWRWIPPKSPNSGSVALLASPTVVDGVVYIGAEDGYFFAVNEATHRALWSDFLGIDAATPAQDCGPGTLGIISTATVATDPATGELTAYVFGPDGYLYALNAATGAIVWQGLVDTPSTTVNDFYSWGSPLVVNGTVYIGSAADCGTPHVAAGVFAFNQSTGAEVAHWSSLPPGDVGASIWSSVALAADGDILVTTGSSCDPCKPPLPLYDESIVRLDPTTLALQDAWQVPGPEQGFDGDFGASPTTFTAMIDGVATPMVAACNKNGYYYALEQDDLAAGTVWQDQITIPYTATGAAEECDAAAIWNGTDLIEGGGAPTTIDGTSYTGSVQALNPSTGVPVWQTGLQGTIVGSPTEDGAGLVAAQTFISTDNELGVYLLNASTGAIVSFIATPDSHLFGQAVFAGNDLLIGAAHGLGLTDYSIPPTVTSASPDQIAAGGAASVTFTGTGFETGATLTITGPSKGIRIKPNTTVVTATTVTADLAVGSATALGAYTVTVNNPDGGSASCASCLTVISGPTLSSISPSSVAPGTTTTVTLTGTGFGVGATVTSVRGVQFSDVDVTGSTTITASMKVSGNATAGSGLTITVINSAAAGGGKVAEGLLMIT